MSRPNALLTPRGRLQLAQCVVDQCWSLRRAAERFQVSVPTAARWAQRYRLHGPAGMEDRSSRPHSSPRRTSTRTERRTSTRTERRIIAVHVNRRWGPAKIGYLLGRRYERDKPGDLVQVDIKKLCRIPDGGGHRVVGRVARWENKTGTTANRRPGYHYLHNAVDDHSRLAYTEILIDETKETAAAFWQRANAWFQAHGITIQRVLSGVPEPYFWPVSSVPWIAVRGTAP